MGGKEIYLIPVLMVFFALGGSIFGMAEETIPYVMIITPLAFMLGYDSIIGAAIVLVGASAVSGLPSSLTAMGMYVSQALLNFIVPSGSGQAALTMPIMTPLADLVGVSRQTAVLAFQFGDGISNIFTPTSGYFMAALAAAGISWTKWVRWIWPLLLIQYIVAAVLITIAHLFIF